MCSITIPSTAWGLMMVMVRTRHSSTMTAELAEGRSRLVAALAEVVFMPQALLGGEVERLFHHMQEMGKPIHTLDDNAKHPLLKARATPLDVQQLVEHLGPARRARNT